MGTLLRVSLTSLRHTAHVVIPDSYCYNYFSIFHSVCTGEIKGRMAHTTGLVLIFSLDEHVGTLLLKEFAEGIVILEFNTILGHEEIIV